MAQPKTVYFCENCGHESPKWVGQCPSCGEWNTHREEVINKKKKKTTSQQWKKDKKERQSSQRPVTLEEITHSAEQRFQAPDEELNRVLGGGLVPGSLILIGGEPGIGKSTLLLQLGLQLPSIRVLYVAGEESARQIKMRSKRLGGANKEFYILTETCTQKIFKQTDHLDPDIVIIDSIQTAYSEQLDSPPGSISQIKHCTGEFQRFAKETATPVFLVGHITKKGSIAGPKVLEHIVDTVLQFEGDRHYAYRVLRTIKNRFGSAAELGIYEMQDSGLRQVSNPSEILLSQREEKLSGIAIGATIEGIRPMLIETQALVSNAVYGTPQRTATGFDLRRLNMLLAVLEKRCGFQLGIKDVFLNIAGGLQVADPAIDLGVFAALLSSLKDQPLPEGYCFAGEVGLSGEVRAVNRIEQRIAEADKLGFKKIFISKYNSDKSPDDASTIERVRIANVGDLMDQLFQPS